ncbi:MarC family protein [Brockia lithotrophica]|uniref:UPF0056 membrane protein n=1 Tax=Brockia lithotrophica TaxID=933949 RepID=A0A660L618_9BACL|nr:MarC family protein [Brockia lithotrophica]RKQ88664.1 multiple antibiotic resistance protein [Brockia lithotrophica]
MLSFAIKVFLALFAVMNPFPNVTLFLALTENLDNAARKAVARRAVVAAALLGLPFVVFGAGILAVLGISLDAFRVTGGIVLFTIAYSLLKGSASPVHAPHGVEHEEVAGQDDVALVPLAVPLLTGPGTMTTLTVYGGAPWSMWDHKAIVAAAFLVVLALTYAFFREAERLQAALSPSVFRLVARVMGLVLAALAVQMAGEGVRGFLGPSPA